MYLIVPVPNPEKKTLAIKYACHTESYFTKLAVEVSKKTTDKISLITDATKELLEVRYSEYNCAGFWANQKLLLWL